MEPHPIHLDQGRKEIRCSDCGHLYLIAQGQRSSRCQVCGNIEFLPESGTPAAGISAGVSATAGLGAISHGLAVKKVFPRMEVEGVVPRRAEPDLSSFARIPDGRRVEEIRMRYQVEWQLWAMVVRNFSDPLFHSAYITQATTAHFLDRAGQRYREHQSVMAPIADERWQASVADLMLGRVESLSALQMSREGRGPRLPWALQLASLDSGMWRMAWIVAGMALAMRIFRLG